MVGTRTARRGAVQRGRRKQWGQGRMAVALPRVTTLCRSRSWCNRAPSCLLRLVVHGEKSGMVAPLQP